MRPLTLKIRGFGNHSDTNIDFSSLPSPIALLAPYGTGKTILLEAMLFCLYGKGGWYNNIYDMLTQGGTGDGKIEFQFEHNSETFTAYRDVRTTAKTKSQTANLFNNSENDYCIAGPKVGDFERYITNLLGDYETFMATVFLSQNKKLDLIGNPGEPNLMERRRNVFNELIGAANLDKESEIAGNAAKEKETIIKELTAQLINPETLEIEKQKIILSIDAEQHSLTENKSTLETKQRDLDTLKKALRDTEGNDDILKAQIQQYETAQREFDNMYHHFKSIEDEHESLLVEAEKIPQYQKQLEEYKVMQSWRETYENTRKQYLKYDEYLKNKIRLEQSIGLLMDSIINLECLGMPTDEIKDLANRLETIIEQGKDIKEQNEANIKINSARALQRNQTQSKIDFNISEKKRLEKRLANKPQTPGGDVCHSCPLLSEFSGIPKQLKYLEEQIAVMQKELSEIPTDEQIQDLSEIRAEYERAKAASFAVEKSKKTETELNKNKELLASLKNQLENLNNEAPEPVEDCSAELKKLQDDLDKLSGTETKLGYCIQAKAKAENLQTILDNLRNQLKELAAKSEALKPLAQSAKESLTNRDRSRKTILDNISTLETEIKNISAEIDSINKHISRHETNIENFNRQIFENSEKNNRIIELKETVDNQRMLQKCFGAKGVRQILLDNAAPELEAIADDLFQKATGGKFRLRISTQKVNQDGSLAEDFSILVTDERGEREANGGYSGGQLQLIQIIFRIATAVWIGKIRGTKPDCLFLDEAFDRLGAEGTDDLLNLLSYMQESIGTIITVTHDSQIADRLPGQIRLVKEYSGVKVYTPEMINI